MVLNKFVWGIFSCIISWLFLSLTQPLIAHSETLNPTTHASTFSKTFTSVSTEQQTTQATDIVEQETEQTHASSENDEPMAPTPASVSVGNSTFKSTTSPGFNSISIFTDPHLLSLLPLTHRKASANILRHRKNIHCNLPLKTALSQKVFLHTPEYQ